MQQIHLKDITPSFFNIQPQTSDVWGCDLLFTKGCNYIIKAKSGHGKTSFCNFIYGLRDDYMGSIMFDGTDIRTLNHKQWAGIRSREIGFLPQDLALFPSLTALENVQIKNQLTNFIGQDKINEWMERVSLTEHAKKLSGIMSYGQQQRVAFIRALSQPSDFIILDEPISHIDESNAKVMAEILMEYKELTGCGIIITSVGNDFPIEYDYILNL